MGELVLEEIPEAVSAVRSRGLAIIAVSLSTPQLKHQVTFQSTLDSWAMSPGLSARCGSSTCKTDYKRQGNRRLSGQQGVASMIRKRARDLRL